MDKSYAIGKHYDQHHSDVAAETEEPIEMRILTKHDKVLVKLIDEGIRLEKAPQLANSKSEWGRGEGLVRLVSKRTQGTQKRINNASINAYNNQITMQETQETDNTNNQTIQIDL